MDSKRPVGRPPILLDENEILRLAKMGCTVQEMADFFGVSRDLLERKYSAIYRQGFADVKMSLRRALLRNAIDNENTTAQIWLSKQYLGMKEPKQEIDFATGVEEITFTDDNGGK